MRKLFEAWLRKEHGVTMPELAYQFNPALWAAWQAAWNLFVPHIEILEDDAEPMVGDVVQYGHNHYADWTEKEPQYRANFIGTRIMERDNKPCIKAKDLRGE